MAAIPLSESALAELKKALRADLPEVSSSHLSEALAAGLRRRTHAALLAELPQHRADPPIELLDDVRFRQRLIALGYADDPEFSFEGLPVTVLIETQTLEGLDIEYRSVRERAWRNLMVSAINEGIRRKLFSLRPNDNRWPNADKESQLFDFTLPNGLPALGYVHNIKFGELSIHAAVNPIDTWVRAFNAGFSAGDVMATGWLEREKGAWLQSFPTNFHCRRKLLQPLAAMEVEPLGYGDRGRLML